LAENIDLDYDHRSYLFRYYKLGLYRIVIRHYYYSAENV